MVEENVNEVLGIEEKTSSNAKDTSKANVEVWNNTAEKTLVGIANVVLWAGIIGTLFCLCTLTTTKVVDPTYTYSIHYDTIFNPAGLAISAGVFISALTTWAVLKVVANISTTLKEIISKMK